MDENTRSQSDETNPETEGGRLIPRRVVCPPIEEGQTSSAAAGTGVVSSAVLLPAAESCAEWVLIVLLLIAWVLSIGAFLHKWKRLRLLPVRTPSLPAQDAPKNLDAVTVVADLDQSVIYKNYPVRLASTLQARFSHLRRSVSLRLANLPVIMATTTRGGRERGGANAAATAGPRREPDAVMLSSFPEETSSLSSSSASASGSSLPPPPQQQQEVSVQPAEAASSLPEVERSVPEVTVWLPEVTLSLAEVNPSRPEVVMSDDSDAVANGYGEDAPRSI